MGGTSTTHPPVTRYFLFSCLSFERRVRGHTRPPSLNCCSTGPPRQSLCLHAAPFEPMKVGEGCLVLSILKGERAHKPPVTRLLHFLPNKCFLLFHFWLFPGRRQGTEGTAASPPSRLSLGTQTPCPSARRPLSCLNHPIFAHLLLLQVCWHLDCSRPLFW